MQIYHIFTSANHIHNSAIVGFFQKKHGEMATQWQDHRFVLLSPPKPEASPLYDNLSFEPGQLQVASEKTGDAYRMLRSISTKDCLILHAAFFSWRFWLRLLCRPKLWKRTAWIMWGGDINAMKAYAHHRSLKGMVYLSLAKVIVPRLGAVSALAPGDYDIVREVFGAKCNNYIRAFYSGGIILRAVVDHEQHGPNNGGAVRVLLGNSGSPDNCHIEALDWLSRYCNQDIEVVCPLGYGGTEKYREDVVEAGQQALGQKFRPVLEMLPREKYIELLDTIDIILFNHRRQQGLFALLYLLAHGKKAYVRHDATTFSMLHDYGIVVKDSCSLPDESFAQFSKQLSPGINEENSQRCKERFSPETAVAEWKRLFELFQGRCSRKVDGKSRLDRLQ